MQGQHSIVRGNHQTPTSPIRGNRGDAATGRDTGPIRGKHSGKYRPTSPIRGNRGGVATGCDTGPIRVSTVESTGPPAQSGATMVA